MDHRRPLLEVISTSPADSKTIQASGADRVQLVSALQIGGLTPSAAVVRKAIEIVDIPTMVMVRHHNQGFVLNHDQKKLLVQEAISLCELGVKGLVIGANTVQYRVDTQFLSMFRSEMSNKIDVTFHKASDQTNLAETYSILKQYGIRRVLTQGGKGPIQANQAVISQIQQIEGVTTLLGGGINFDNIRDIVSSYRPKQVHIGTCVREPKYGPVNHQLLSQFIERLSSSK